MPVTLQRHARYQYRASRSARRRIAELASAFLSLISSWRRQPLCQYWTWHSTCVARVWCDDMCGTELGYGATVAEHVNIFNPPPPPYQLQVVALHVTLLDLAPDRTRPCLRGGSGGAALERERPPHSLNLFQQHFPLLLVAPYRRSVPDMPYQVRRLIAEFTRPHSASFFLLATSCVAA
eukprot:1846022-Rhodomonas_salina.1